MPERDVDIFVEVHETQVGRKADGVVRPLRSTADGSVFVAPWVIGHLLDGRIFSANAGTVTSPITSAGVVAATTPDVYMRIPVGTKVIPLHINVSLDALTDDQDAEIVAAISNRLDTTPTSPSTMTVVNRMMGHSNGSNVLVDSDVSGVDDMAGTGFNYLEFWRVIAEYGAKPAAGQNEAGQAISFDWYAEEDVPISVKGPASLAIFVGKASRTYFATITWVELPS
jgi:hypothetical protein